MPGFHSNAHDTVLVTLRVDYTMDSLRSDPRYAELVRKIGFPQWKAFRNLANL